MVRLTARHKQSRLLSDRDFLSRRKSLRCEGSRFPRWTIKISVAGDTVCKTSVSASGDWKRQHEAAYFGIRSEDSRTIKRPRSQSSTSRPSMVCCTFLDGLLIVSAVDIFGAPKMIGATDDVGAIRGHSTPALSGGSTTELSATSA